MPSRRLRAPQPGEGTRVELPGFRLPSLVMPNNHEPDGESSSDSDSENALDELVSFAELVPVRTVSSKEEEGSEDGEDSDDDAPLLAALLTKGRGRGRRASRRVRGLARGRGRGRGRGAASAASADLTSFLADLPAFHPVTLPLASSREKRRRRSGSAGLFTIDARLDRSRSHHPMRMGDKQRCGVCSSLSSP